MLWARDSAQSGFRLICSVLSCNVIHIFLFYAIILPCVCLWSLGNVNDIFAINPNTGDITMQKPVDVAGPIVLTVMVKKPHKPSSKPF